MRCQRVDSFGAAANIANAEIARAGCNSENIAPSVADKTNNLTPVQNAGRAKAMTKAVAVLQQDSYKTSHATGCAATSLRALLVAIT